MKPFKIRNIEINPLPLILSPMAGVFLQFYML